jgi:hypothetical protein
MGYIQPGVDGWLHHMKARRPFRKGRYELPGAVDGSNEEFTPKVVPHKTGDTNQGSGGMLKSIRSIQQFAYLRQKLGRVLLIVLGTCFAVLLLYQVVLLIIEYI